MTERRRQTIPPAISEFQNGKGVIYAGFSPETERRMKMLHGRIIGIYVNRRSRQWIVRDEQGQFWILPIVDEPWKHLEPFELDEDTELEPVPGHYRSLLGLPPDITNRK